MATKMVSVVIGLLVFSALIGTVVANMSGINLTAYPEAEALIPIVILMVVLGGGVFYVLKEFGIVKGL